jgi:hypothetical protein
MNKDMSGDIMLGFFCLLYETIWSHEISLFRITHLTPRDSSQPLFTTCTRGQLAAKPGNGVVDNLGSKDRYARQTQQSYCHTNCSARELERSCNGPFARSILQVVLRTRIRWGTILNNKHHDGTTSLPVIEGSRRECN